MTPASAVVPMLLVYDLLRTALVQRLAAMPAPASKEVLEGLQGAVNAVRAYTITTPEDLGEVWHLIRKNPLLTDFVFELAIQLEFMLTDSAVGFEGVIKALAKALGAQRGARPGSGTHKSAIDADLLQRLGDPATLESLLRDNRWYVLVLLLQHRPDLLMIKREAG